MFSNTSLQKPVDGIQGKFVNDKLYIFDMLSQAHVFGLHVKMSDRKNIHSEKLRLLRGK